uniref:Uncharacterized protein n=1 Tax=Cacopsylla melanoneura TaxID=428564 RepID=A0A8D9DXT0_9HEMI
MLFGQRRTDSIRNEAQTRRGQPVQDIRQTKGRRRQTNKRRIQRRVGEGARTLDIAIRARITDQTEKTRRPESSDTETSAGARKSRKEYDLETRQEERCPDQTAIGTRESRHRSASGEAKFRNVRSDSRGPIRISTVRSAPSLCRRLRFGTSPTLSEPRP